MDFSKFIQLELQRGVKGWDASKEAIAVVHHFPTYRGQVGAISKFLSNKYNLLHIYTSPDGNRKDHEVYFPRVIKDASGSVKVVDLNLDGSGVELKAMLCTDCTHDTFFDKEFISKQAKRIYFPHQIFGFSLTDYVCDVFDAVVLPSPCVKDNKNLGQCRLIEGGYPKLDVLIDGLYQKSSEAADSIIYAPTLRMPINETIDDHAAMLDIEILSFLLGNFELPVIYRPHPYNSVLHKDDIKYFTQVRDHFETEGRIRLDLDPLPYDSYSKSKVMLTDVSVTAFTYSLATLNPSGFFIPYDEKKIFGTESDFISKLGRLLRNPLDIKKFIGLVLSGEAMGGSSIEKFRNDMVYNVGDSTRVICEEIESLIS